MIEPTPSDADLLAAFVRGDRDSLGALAERHERSLLGLARGVLGGRSDLAVDAVQETWVRVIRFADGFDGRSTVKTWLYRILINQCRTIHAALVRADGTAPGLSQGASPGEGRAGDERDALRRALRGLSDDRRIILLLCYHAGITHEQAAAVLEIPVGTLKSRLHSALNELRESLADKVAP